MWHGEAQELSPLHQIKQAYDNHNVNAGVIITLLDKLSEEFEKAKDELEKDLGIPIVVLLKKETLKLFITNLVEMVEE